MKKQTIHLYLTVMMAVMLMSGCAKESMNDQMNDVIRFTTTMATYFDEAGTKSSLVASEKTELVSDDGKVNIPIGLNTAPGIDAIAMKERTVLTKGPLVNDNENGDLSNIDLPVTIGSFEVAAWTGTTISIPPYTVVTYSNDKWSTASEYLWKKGDEKTFIAYANLPSSGAAITSEAAGTQKLEYTVPDAASAQNDILMGYYKGTGNNSGTAAITFYHPLTAVKFVVGDMLDVTAITKISLKGVYASGNTTQSAAGTSFTWEGTTSTKTVSQNITGNLPSKGSQVGEAFLLIPQTITEDAAVEVTIVATINGTPTELVGTLNSCQWKAGYTNIYSIGYNLYNYEFNIVDEKGEIIDTPTLTFTNTETPSEPQDEIIYSVKIDTGVSTPQSWKIKSYQIKNTTPVTVDNTSFENGGGLNACITTKGELSVTSLPRTIIDRGGHEYWVNSDDRTDNLDWSPADWTNTTAASPIDLSTFDFKTDTQNARQMTTANCYIIRHAGTYKLPLIYGNGVVNGAVNEKSYYPNLTGESNLQRFFNHKGEGITSAFIENNTDCKATEVEIIWQDEAEVVKNVQIVGTEKTAGSYGTSDVRYLQFTVDNENIRQNNALIAVKDADGNIMWSWCIWTTNDPAILQNAIPVINYVGNTYKFLALYNLGYVNPKEYLSREPVNITLEQEESGNLLVVTVNQTGAIEPARGNYYQFGRKDPMCRKDNPAVGKFEIKEGGNIDMGTAIMNPGTFYKEKNNGKSWSNIYYNIWKGTNAKYGRPEEQDNTMIKTIYDPSPVGYKIPAGNACSGFDMGTDYETYRSIANFSTRQVPNAIGPFNNGFNFKTGDGDKTIFFPACGYRSSEGVIDKGLDLRPAGQGGGYWETEVYSYRSGYAYALDFAMSYGVIPSCNTRQAAGLSVRPVLE